MITEVTANNFDEEVIRYNGRVLVDFWAEWCGPCKMLSPLIDEAAEEADTVKFCKCNCDEARDLALSYNIMSIPCLLIFENGEEINRSIGYISKEEILDLVK